MAPESSDLTEHAWIALRRKREYFGCLRDLRILIDGREIDRLSIGTERCYAVTVGEHSVQVRMDWSKSLPHKLHLVDGEVAKLECGLRYRKPNLTFLLNGTFAPHRLFEVRSQPTPLAESKEGILPGTPLAPGARTLRSWIVLTRKREWFAVLRDLRIYIDGREFDRLPFATQQCYPVGPGTHNVHVQLDWCRSEPHPVQLADGETAMLECGLHTENSYFLVPAVRLLTPELLLEVRRQKTASAANEEGV
jgi:hypothetical protein